MCILLVEILKRRNKNYIQYLVITYNGKEPEAVHLKSTQYYKSNIVRF